MGINLRMGFPGHVAISEKLPILFLNRQSFTLPPLMFEFHFFHVFSIGYRLPQYHFENLCLLIDTIFLCHTFLRKVGGEGRGKERI